MEKREKEKKKVKCSDFDSSRHRIEQKISFTMPPCLVIVERAELSPSAGSLEARVHKVPATYQSAFGIS